MLYFAILSQVWSFICGFAFVIIMGKRKAETAAGDEPGTSGQEEALSNVVYIGYVFG